MDDSDVENHHWNPNASPKVKSNNQEESPDINPVVEITKQPLPELIM